MVEHVLRRLVNRLDASATLISQALTVAFSLNLVGTLSTTTVEGARQSAQMVTTEITQPLCVAPVSWSHFLYA